MIYTTLQNLDRYLGLHENLDRAIRYLKEADLSALTPGRNEIHGDEVYVNRFGYETVPPEKGQWEGHLAYADIHVVLSGREAIALAPSQSLTVTARVPEEDFVGYQGPAQLTVPLAPGQILIAFPEDAHMVKLQSPTPERVEKACFKVKL